MKQLNDNQKFFILCPGRTGSTSLRNALNARPDIICHGELFGQNRVLGFVRSPLERALRPLGLQQEVNFNVRRWCEGDFWDLTMNLPARHVGAKLLTPHLFNSQNINYIEKITQCNPKIIILWRRNLIKRYISELKHRQTQNPDQPLPPNAFSLDCLSADCARQTLMFKYAEAFFLCQIPEISLHRVHTEDFACEPVKTLEECLRFLSADDSNVKVPSSFNVSAVQSDPLSEALEELERQAAISLPEYVNVPCPV